MKAKILKSYKNIADVKITELNESLESKPKAREFSKHSKQDVCIDESYSLNDILKMNYAKLYPQVFTIYRDQGENISYVQLKIKAYRKEEKLMKIVQIIDVTDYIMYTFFKAQNEFTTLINACVSHELRNPLNCIIAKNIEKTALYLELRNNLNSLQKYIKDSETYK